jgi:hypothetical protein
MGKIIVSTIYNARVTGTGISGNASGLQQYDSPTPDVQNKPKNMIFGLDLTEIQLIL